MDATLCSECRRALKRFVWRWRTIRPPTYQKPSRKVHQNLETFKTAVSGECYLCWLLWQAIEERTGQVARFEQTVSSHSFITYIELYFFKNGTYTHIDYTALAERIEGSRETHDDVFNSTVRLPISKVTGKVRSGPLVKLNLAIPVDRQDPNERPGKTPIIHRIQQRGRTWTRQCLESHTLCSSYSESAAWYPGRLIYIEGRKSEELFRLRLVERTNLPKTGRYTTLSHRWSDRDFFRLTSVSQELMKSGFVSSCLPATFQDAVTATYYLGFCYVWIDSLCILQDSKKDWLDQSAEMHQVYTNSVCTLAATSAADCTARMFSQCENGAIVANQVNLRTWARRSKIGLYDERLWNLSVDQSPLTGRGWVFQERMLSPATIHFTEHQMLWDCRELRASENWPMGIPDQRKTGDSLSSLLWKQLLLTKPGVEATQKGLEWHVIVQEYSEMQLTVPSDRLLALSGVANAFATAWRRVPEEYVAGMWRSTLSKDLFWARAANKWNVHKKAARPAGCYLAPTFSWASVTTSVSSYDYSTTPKFSVKDIHLQHANHDPFGKLEAGFVTIRGVVLSFELEHGKSGWKTQDVVVSSKTKIRACVSMDESGERSQELLYCVHGIDNRDSWGQVSSFILLEHVRAQGIGTFRRVGLATEVKLSHEQVLSMAQDPDRQPSEKIPSMDYFPEDSTHLIKII